MRTAGEHKPGSILDQSIGRQDWRSSAGRRLTLLVAASLELHEAIDQATTTLPGLACLGLNLSHTLYLGGVSAPICEVH